MKLDGLYEGKVENGALVLETFEYELEQKGYVKKGVASSQTIDAADIGAINKESVLYIEFRKAAGHGYGLLRGVTIDQIAHSLQGLADIEGISCSIPMDIMEEPDLKEAVDDYTHKVYTAFAATGSADDVYKTRVLVNPAAIENIADRGAYRDITLKEEFGGASFSTLLTGPALKTALQVAGSSPAP